MQLLTERERFAIRTAVPLVPRKPQRPLDIGLVHGATRNQFSLF